MTYFPHCKLTYGILYGCPPAIEREVLDRLSLTTKWAGRHPLLLPGIFAELERGRHLKVVERNIDDLEGEVFQLDFQPSLKEKIRTKDAHSRNAQKKKAWLDTTYLRNGLISWRTQLSKMADHCDELPSNLFTEYFTAPGQMTGRKRWTAEFEDEPTDERLVGRENDVAKEEGHELTETKNITRLVKERLLAIMDEYEDKIRDTTTRVDGMAMATQWVRVLRAPEFCSDLTFLTMRNLTQSHGETNVEIALATIRDSRYMKSIALVTMVFLPGTFLAVSFPI